MISIACVIAWTITTILVLRSIRNAPRLREREVWQGAEQHGLRIYEHEAGKEAATDGDSTNGNDWIRDLAGVDQPRGEEMSGITEGVLIGDRFDGETFGCNADDCTYTEDGQICTFRICKHTGRIVHYMLTDRIVNGRLAFGFLRSIKAGEQAKH